MDHTIFIIYFTIFCLLMVLILTTYYILSTNGVLKKWEVKPYNSTIEGFVSNEGLTGNQAYPANIVKRWEGNTQETIICNYDFIGTILLVAKGSNGDGVNGGGGGGWYYDLNFQFKKGSRYTISKDNNGNTSLKDETSTDYVICYSGAGIGGGDCKSQGSSFSKSNCHKGHNGGGGSNGTGTTNTPTFPNPRINIGGTNFIVSGGGQGGGKHGVGFPGEYTMQVGNEAGSNNGGKSSITGFNPDVNAQCYGNGGGGCSVSYCRGGGAGGGGVVVIYYTTTEPTTPPPTTQAPTTQAPTTPVTTTPVTTKPLPTTPVLTTPVPTTPVPTTPVPTTPVPTTPVPTTPVPTTPVPTTPEPTQFLMPYNQIVDVMSRPNF